MPRWRTAFTNGSNRPEPSTNIFASMPRSASAGNSWRRWRSEPAMLPVTFWTCRTRIRDVRPAAGTPTVTLVRPSWPGSPRTGDEVQDRIVGTEHLNDKDKPGHRGNCTSPGRTTVGLSIGPSRVGRAEHPQESSAHPRVGVEPELRRRERRVARRTPGRRSNWPMCPKAPFPRMRVPFTPFLALLEGISGTRLRTTPSPAATL